VRFVDVEVLGRAPAPNPSGSHREPMAEPAAHSTADGRDEQREPEHIGDEPRDQQQ
jgi:hypothetical protein